MEHGIEETKELLVGINELAICLIERLKDGVGVDDFTAIWAKLQQDQEFSDKLKDAYVGVSNIPAEIKDLDLSEGIDLAQLQISYLPAIIKAVKKEA